MVLDPCDTSITLPVRHISFVTWIGGVSNKPISYERELHGGSRPPLRKIANQDAPAAFPMVLCVSNIFWSPASLTEDGVVIESYPELELTDGWYRLRAQVDPPMARAIKRGIIRIGRKIGFAGATVSCNGISDCSMTTRLIFLV